MVLKETNSIKNLAKKKKKDSIKRRETFAPFKSIFFEKKKKKSTSFDISSFYALFNIGTQVCWRSYGPTFSYMSDSNVTAQSL